MNAIAAIEELRKLAFASGEASNWWAELEGEVRQGRRDARYLEKTLQTDLEKTMTTGDYAEYRSQTRRRQQYFLSGGGNIDGRFRGIGVEEKCAVLNRDKLLDGVLCRGLVWTLGNPQNIEPDQLGAFGIFVKQGAGLLQPALAQAYFGALVLARKANVHPLFVDGNTGERWPREIGETSALPDWLVASKLFPLEAPPVNRAALAVLEPLEFRAKPTERLFGSKKVFSTQLIDGHQVAIAEWSNEWQMLDVGLMLRAMGNAAVKVCYNGTKILKPGVHGVEKRVAEGMRAQFGVIVDWGVNVS